MPGYPLFIPEFVQSTNSSLFWFKIVNELSEFRNYLISHITLSLKNPAASRLPHFVLFDFFVIMSGEIKCSLRSRLISC